MPTRSASRTSNLEKALQARQHFGIVASDEEHPAQRQFGERDAHVM